MRTCIKVSLADNLGDQTYYSLNSEEPDVLRPILSTGAENAFAITRKTSTLNGNGVACIPTETGISFSYASDREVNHYSGFVLTVIYDKEDADYPFVDDDIADYTGVPDWVQSGLTSVTAKGNLVTPAKWLKVNSSLTFKNDGSSKLLASIVDKLLTALSSGQRAHLGLFAQNDRELVLKQQILVLALKCLPVSIQNKITYNTGSNSDIDDFDIFCTTYPKSRFNNYIDAENIGGNLINPYAKYVAVAERNPRAGLENVKTIEELNSRAGYKIMRENCEKGLPCEHERLKECLTSYESCKEHDKDKYIRTSFKKVTYNLFFSSNYFFSFASGLNVWNDLCKSQLGKYLAAQIDENDITYKQLCEGANAFFGADCEALLDKLYAKCGEDTAISYFDFLHKIINENIYDEVRRQINSFLYGNIDSYSVNVQNIFRSYLEKQPDDYIREYALKCSKDTIGKFFKKLIELRCNTVFKNIDWCDYLRSKNLPYEWLLDYGLLEGNESPRERAKYLEFLLQQKNYSEIGATTKLAIDDLLFKQYNKSHKMQEAVEIYFDTLLAKSVNTLLECVYSCNSFEKSAFIAGYFKKKFSSVDQNVDICARLKKHGKEYGWFIDFELLKGESREILKYVKFLLNELPDSALSAIIRPKLFTDVDANDGLKKAYINYFEELSEADLFSFINQFGNLSSNKFITDYLNSKRAGVRAKLELYKALNNAGIAVTEVDWLFAVSDFKAIGEFTLLNELYEYKPSAIQSINDMSAHFEKVLTKYLDSNNYRNKPQDFLTKENLTVENLSQIIVGLKFLNRDTYGIKATLETIKRNIEEERKAQEERLKAEQEKIKELQLKKQYDRLKKSLVNNLNAYVKEMPHESGDEKEFILEDDYLKKRKNWNDSRLRERKSDQTGAKNDKDISPRTVTLATLISNIVFVMLAGFFCYFVLIPNCGMWIHPALLKSFDDFTVAIVEILFIELAVQLFKLPSNKNVKWTAGNLFIYLAILPCFICLYFVAVFGLNLFY